MILYFAAQSIFTPLKRNDLLHLPEVERFTTTEINKKVITVNIGTFCQLLLISEKICDFFTLQLV